MKEVRILSKKHDLSREQVKKFIGYYKPYKNVFFADLFFALLSAVIALCIPLIVRHITGEVIYYGQDELMKTVLIFAAVLVSMVAVDAYAKYYVSYYGHVIGAKMEADMRTEIFAHIQKLSFSFFDNRKVGKLMSRITTDLFDISELLHHGPEMLIISIIKLIGSFTILLVVNWRLALISFCLLPVIGFYALGLAKKMRKAFKENRARMSDINMEIEDNLSGIRVVKSFANENIEMERFGKTIQRFLDSKFVTYITMAKFHCVLGSFITLLTVMVIIAGSWFMSRGSIDAADLITFLLYINNFTDPIRTLIDLTELFQNGISGYERFLEIVNIEPEINDKPDAIEMKSVKGEVEFENVSFRYEEGLENVLSNVSMKVEAGKCMALVGPSGAGKTTFCSLIPRFYEATEGNIRIDGVDIRDIKQSSLRSKIGVVQQDVFLFIGTVLDNIRYGKPDATMEEVIEAAKLANAHDFIMELPEGYNTNIGQRGVKLSGGQKQRLSIARVFLKNPPILIFDEATSSLDNESERIVQESLELLAKNRTTFVIAHRLSTIRNADEILVLTENGIEERGTHKELLDKNGVYASLYKTAVG